MRYDVRDAYSDATAAAGSLRERIAEALFVRRGFRADAWLDPAQEPLRRDCRYLADAVLEVLDEPRRQTARGGDE